MTTWSEVIRKYVGTSEEDRVKRIARCAIRVNSKLIRLDHLDKEGVITAIYDIALFVRMSIGEAVDKYQAYSESLGEGESPRIDNESLVLRIAMALINEQCNTTVQKIKNESKIRNHRINFLAIKNDFIFVMDCTKDLLLYPEKAMSVYFKLSTCMTSSPKLLTALTEQQTQVKTATIQAFGVKERENLKTSKITDETARKYYMDLVEAGLTDKLIRPKEMMVVWGDKSPSYVTTLLNKFREMSIPFEEKQINKRDKGYVFPFNEDKEDKGGEVI